MKPDQERVKNLLLDTVTLLCKNSLQYESKLRVEGLLGVSVDDNDVFFLHISENFRSATCAEEVNGGANKEDQSSCSREKNNEQSNDSNKTLQNDSDDSACVVIKSEIVSETNSSDFSALPTSLNSPQTVSHPSTVVAGQRRPPFRRKRSPFNENAQNTSQNFQGQLPKDSNQGNQDEDYSYQDAADGASYDQFGDPTGIKQEAGWDQPSPSKRHASGDAGPWPNLSGISEMAAQAANMTEDGSGEFTQPGCSSWSISNTQLQDSSMINLNDVPSPVDAQGMDPKTCQSTGLWSIEGSGVDRTFRCTVCSRDFRRKEQLKLHFRTHTGERPHKCHICHSSFSRPGNLTAHMRTHTGERPFVCQICHMRFSQSNNLKRHMKCHQQGENGEDIAAENSDGEQNRENVFTEI